jgi:putative membrane protein
MLTTVIAHGGQPLAPHDVIGSWRPGVGLSIALALLVYQRGFGSRSDHLRRRLFLGGAVALATALVTPLDALAGSLASAHMVQHLLILLVAAPLLAASAPLPILLRAIPVPVQRSLWRGLRGLGIARQSVARLISPATVWLAYTGTLWLWHAAVPYQAAVRNEWIHGLEHASFLIVGFSFWHFALGRGRQPMMPGFRVLFMFTAALQGVLLAALLTFGSTPWYPEYAESSGAFGLDPLTDQQLAGLLMWIPSGLVYTGVSVAVLVHWIGQSEPLPVGESRGSH